MIKDAFTSVSPGKSRPAGRAYDQWPHRLRPRQGKGQTERPRLRRDHSQMIPLPGRHEEHDKKMKHAKKKRAYCVTKKRDTKYDLCCSGPQALRLTARGGPCTSHPRPRCYVKRHPRKSYANPSSISWTISLLIPITFDLLSSTRHRNVLQKDWIRWRVMLTEQGMTCKRGSEFGRSPPQVTAATSYWAKRH